jgi:aryl carrier-like protein
MSGESRWSYHGVPRIIEGSYSCEEEAKKYIEAHMKEELDETPRHGCPKNDFGLDSNRMIHTLRYLKENRINLNFRQVVLEPEK